MLDLISIADLLLKGFQLVGAGLVALIRLVLRLLHLEWVPDWIIQLAWIIFWIAILLRFGKHISKIILIALLLVVASLLFNALLVDGHFSFG